MIIIEYCKLFMVFLLIGTIIGLSSSANRALSARNPRLSVRLTPGISHVCQSQGKARVLPCDLQLHRCSPAQLCIESRRNNTGLWRKTFRTRAAKEPNPIVKAEWENLAQTLRPACEAGGRRLEHRDHLRPAQGWVRSLVTLKSSPAKSAPRRSGAKFAISADRFSSACSSPARACCSGRMSPTSRTTSCCSSSCHRTAGCCCFPDRSSTGLAHYSACRTASAYRSCPWPVVDWFWRGEFWPVVLLPLVPLWLCPVVVVELDPCVEAELLGLDLAGQPERADGARYRRCRSPQSLPCAGRRSGLRGIWCSTRRSRDHAGKPRWTRTCCTSRISGSLRSTATTAVMIRSTHR